jgi:O-acetyl-ADP-ribose deacetylase (regulator of RNase III)
MITFTQGNLLDAPVEALVNTVNTVGVMGKGIALMFRDAFPENLKAYEAACKAGEVEVGRMFVTRRAELMGPKWIINFPTKKHWRNPSKIEWVDAGLEDLKRIIVAEGIGSIALPPLGSGNGGLNWNTVRDRIEAVLGELPGVEVVVYEPTDRYMAVAKRKGVEKLTPARALVAELVRRYSVLGFECTLLEIQKLAYLLERRIENQRLPNPLDLQFAANKYGPYADRLRHLLDGLDGSYLHADKRLGDATAFDTISFDEAKRDKVSVYLQSEAKAYAPALDATSDLIDGFESPLGMELLATVDWLLFQQKVPQDVAGVRQGLRAWPGPGNAAERKMRLFDDRLLAVAIKRLQERGPALAT